MLEGTEQLKFIPIAGLLIYVGLISGYIPSPLYHRNEKWPREYAILQLVFLVLTAARITEWTYNPETGANDEDEESEYNENVEEFCMFVNWLEATLWKWFYKYFKEDFLESILEIGQRFADVGLVAIIGIIVNRNDKLRQWNDTNLPMPMVFLRNLFLLCAFELWSSSEGIFDTEGDLYMYCESQYNITPGLVAPDYPTEQLLTEFSDAWKEFHPSNLALVRLSHSILYPSILLLLTQRRMTSFVLWVLFMDIDFFHALADMFHYVSGPELADDRLDFQSESSSLCYVNVLFVQTFAAYPLNFLYLTTSMGDTNFSQMEDLMLVDEL